MRTLLNPSTTSPVVTDVALLVSRVVLGVLLLAHGWQKFTEWTLAGTTAGFTEMGVPLAAVAAPYVAVAEAVGGLLLILGVLTPLAAGLNALNMLGALVLVHASNGVFVANNGYELVGALFAGLLLVTVLGAGRFSVDRLISRGRPAATGTATEQPVEVAA